MRELKILAFVLGINLLICPLAISKASALDLEIMKTSFLKGDYASSIKEGERVLAKAQRREQGLDELYYLLALSYLKDGNYLRSADIFEIIVKEFKNSRFKEEAGLGLGDAYLAKGDFKEADRRYNELLLKFPKTRLKAGLYYRLSLIGLKTADSGQQKEYLVRLKSEFPQSAEARMKEGLFPLDLKPQPAQQSSGSTPGIYYGVQVGAFSTAANAKNLSRKLEQQGYFAYVEESSSRDKTIYKVKVGKFSQRSQAKSLEKKLSGQGYPTKVYP